MIYTLTLNPALDKEYQVPKLFMDEVMRMSNLRIDFGGKGFNVSRMLKSLGIESTALGFVGGHTGMIITEGLESLGISANLTQIKGETRTNTSIVDESDDHYIKINEKGPNVSAEEVDLLLRKVKSLVKPGDFWVMAGSLPNNVPDDTYAKIIHLIKNAGAFAVLDTSGSPLILGVEEQPFLIKPNIYELQTLVDQEVQEIADLKKVVAILHARGVKNILVSLGEKGAFLSDSQQCWQGQPPKIEVKNPIGAGDAMVAGLVWRLSIGDTLGAALPWSIACGTAAAHQPGTGMPSLAQVMGYKKQVIIKEI